MQMNESKKEDEIKGKMETDDIGEIFRLTENIPLCKSKRKYHNWSPPSESELKEKWSEKYCLSEIRNYEWKVFPHDLEYRIHEKEFIPNPEGIRPEEKDKNLSPPRLYRPVQIRSGLSEIVWEEEVPESECEDDPESLPSRPLSREESPITDSIFPVDESYDKIRDKDRESESCTHRDDMSETRIGRDRRESEESHTQIYEHKVLRESSIREKEWEKSKSIDIPSFRFVLEPYEKNPREDEWYERDHMDNPFLRNFYMHERSIEK